MKNMLKPWARIDRRVNGRGRMRPGRRNGQAMVEFAFVFPIFLAFIFGGLGVFLWQIYDISILTGACAPAAAALWRRFLRISSDWTRSVPARLVPICSD